MRTSKHCSAMVEQLSKCSDRDNIMVRMCKSAYIGAVKTINGSSTMLVGMDDMDVMQDAALAVLTHANPDTEGAMSYSGKCGRNAALKALETEEKKKNIVISTERLNPDGEYYTIPEVLGYASPFSSDELTESSDSALRLSILTAYLDRQPECDKRLLEFLAAGMKYRAIADLLGCEEGTARKRAMVLRKRIQTFIDSRKILFC